MPTYEYECSKCGRVFEKFQKMTDAPKGQCPKCKGVGKRLISAGSGLIFKGSGFYATDYKNKSKDSSTREKKSVDNKQCASCPSAGCGAKGKQ